MDPRLSGARYGLADLPGSAPVYQPLRTDAAAAGAPFGAHARVAYWPSVGRASRAASAPSPMPAPCPRCQHQPPEGSRFCNLCGALLLGSAARFVEKREIFLDLADLRLPAYLSDLQDRSVVASYIYERFTPFADDGWQWTSFPGDASFDGWVYGTRDGAMAIVGVRLLCTRDRLRDSPWTDPTHHVSQYRVQQLATGSWGAVPGTKRLPTAARAGDSQG